MPGQAAALLHYLAINANNLLLSAERDANPWRVFFSPAVGIEVEEAKNSRSALTARAGRCKFSQLLSVLLHAHGE